LISEKESFGIGPFQPVGLAIKSAVNDQIPDLFSALKLNQLCNFIEEFADIYSLYY